MTQVSQCPNKHLADLEAEIRRYVDSTPYAFPAERDPEHDILTVKPAILTTQPPHELGFIFGECLGCLRSSLDYIAAQLALKYSPASFSKGEHTPYFPLWKNRWPSHRAVGLANYGIPTAALDAIERLQPYHAGNEPLGLLNALVNQDKHSRPLFAVSVPDTISLEVLVVGTPIRECVLTSQKGNLFFAYNASKANLVYTGINPDTGGHLLSFTFDSTLGPGFTNDAPIPSLAEQQARDVQVHGKVSVLVSLDHPLVPTPPASEMLGQTLAKIVKCVADVIPVFDPFF